MPFIIGNTGHIKSLTVNGDMILNVDFAPTLVEFAGLPIPSDIQGHSFTALLRGEKPKDWRTAMYYRYYHYPQDHRVQPHYGIRTERYKLIYFNKIDQWELFDLQKDPRELNNVYAEQAYAETVKQLKGDLYRLKKE